MALTSRIECVNDNELTSGVLLGLVVAVVDVVGIVDDNDNEERNCVLEVMAVVFVVLTPGDCEGFDKVGVLTMLVLVLSVLLLTALVLLDMMLFCCNDASDAWAKSCLYWEGWYMYLDSLLLSVLRERVFIQK